MEFSKIVGSGNDFIIVDNRKRTLKNRKSLAIKLCNRKFGIGADGIIFIENSNLADYKMRIFNPDGSEAEMCGNGLRCVLRFLKENNLISGNKVIVETKAGVLEGEIRGKRARVEIKIIEKPKLNIEIPLNSEIVIGHYINTGVPHTVIFVDNIDKVDIEKIGPLIRYNRIFGTHGTNVNWVEVLEKNTIKIRTYERGVEGETLSCGTGATASAIICSLLKKFNSPIKIITRGGEILKVYFNRNYKKVYLEGSTFYSFKGVWIES